jgi:hypothetical protein
MREMIETLRALPGNRLCDRMPEESLAALASLNLPHDHQQFLREANGALACHGYVRLHGFRCPTCADLVWWNDEDTWKFAWRAVAGFLAFGETGWGDQFAYSLENLARGDTAVFSLDSFEMQPEKLASGFSDFMANDFLRQAQRPDSMTSSAITRIGALEWNEHVSYIPSLLLGGTEDVNNVHKLDARASMIINGDIATQAEAAPDHLPQSVVTYLDDKGRARTRVIWDQR